MRVVIALGGSAVLKRGEPLTVQAQRANVRAAAPMLASVARRHQLVLTHGNGPQVAASTETEAVPLDFLRARTEGMIGYVLEQELGNLLPADFPFATLLTMIEVEPTDPAFGDPTVFVGPLYGNEKAGWLAAELGWIVKPDGSFWRRVLPSPRPKRILESRAIRWLLEKDVVVICAASGGMPTMFLPGEDRRLVGVEAVIDKDLAGELLAREVSADVFVLATDVDGVYLEWGTPRQRRIDLITPELLRAMPFPAGSMGQKVAAAAAFTERTGNRAAIGSLAEIEALVNGDAGTQVVSGQ